MIRITIRIVITRKHNSSLRAQAERKTRFWKVEKIMKKETLLDIGEAVVNVAAELLKNKIEKSVEGKQ